MSKMHTSVDDIIFESAKHALGIQRRDGSFDGGTNGLYNHPETPIRNTAHYVLLFIRALELSKKSVFEEGVSRAVGYLMNSVRSCSGVPVMRMRKGSADSNGVVGAAWLLEALIAVGDRVDGYKECIDAACELVLAHPMDPETGRYGEIDDMGRARGWDMTFNHQLWFAAMVGELGDRIGPVVVNRSEFFLEEVLGKAWLYPGGIIFHAAPFGSVVDTLTRGGEAARLDRAKIVRAPLNAVRQWKKSLGYHGFNLYAIAMLRNKFGTHQLWKKEKILKIINHINNIEYDSTLDTSEYSFYYNLSGFEFAYGAEVFGLGDELVSEWIAHQLRRTYERVGLFTTRGARDKVTAAARVYELTRLTGKYEVCF